MLEICDQYEKSEETSDRKHGVGLSYKMSRCSDIGEQENPDCLHEDQRINDNRGMCHYEPFSK